jgi:hypothetical protein
MYEDDWLESDYEDRNGSTDDFWSYNDQYDGSGNIRMLEDWEFEAIQNVLDLMGLSGNARNSYENRLITALEKTDEPDEPDMLLKYPDSDNFNNPDNFTQAVKNWESALLG